MLKMVAVHNNAGFNSFMHISKNIWSISYETEFTVGLFWMPFFICSIVLGYIRRSDVVGRVPAFQTGGPGSIPGGVRNFNSYPRIGCVSFVFCPVLSPAEALTLCWPHIQGGLPLCICLVFWSIDNCSPYRHLTHEHLGCKVPGGVSPRLGEGKSMKKKEKERRFSDI